jgi:L-amino acid N-acyltransferase YncA
VHDDSDLRFRDATVDDAAALLAIYRPIVERTAVSFEETPPGLEEFADRIATLQSDYGWVVAEYDEGVVGYAHAAPHRIRSAYRFSVETAVYVAQDMRGRGVGHTLYRELIARLGAAGFESAYAGIALPNPASVGLHERVGFTHVGTFPRVGFKLGRWHDVGWWYLPLQGQIDR